MLCIHCNKITSEDNLYCMHCGNKLDMDFDEISDSLEKTIYSEHATESEEFFRWILILVFFFFFSGWLFEKLWNPEELELTVTPGYFSKIKTSNEWQDLHRPLLIQESKDVD